MRTWQALVLLGTGLSTGCSALPNSLRDVVQPPKDSTNTLLSTAQADVDRVELYPDMLAIPPVSVAIQGQDGQPMLRFTTAMANTGSGPLLVRARVEGSRTISTQEVLDRSGNVVATAPAGEFEYHPTHHHFHIDQVTRYELRQGSLNGPIAALADKVSFCLEDTVPYGGRNTERRFEQCTATMQGISPGWCDVYKSEVPGQELSLANLPRDEYYLVTIFDPTQKFRDADRSNNTAWVKLELDPQRYFVHVIQESLQLRPEDYSLIRFHRTPSWR